MPKIKVITISLLTPLLTSAGPFFGSPALAQESGKISKNTNVKRWLEADKRIFLLPHADGTVEILLAKSTSPLWFLFSMGRFHIVDNGEQNADAQPGASKEPGESKKDKEDVRIKSTKKSTEILLMGASTSNTALADAGGKAPPPYELNSSEPFNLLAVGEYKVAREKLNKIGKCTDAELSNGAMLAALNGDTEGATKTLSARIMDSGDAVDSAVRFNLAYLRAAKGKVREAKALLKPFAEESGKIKLLSLLTLARLELIGGSPELASEYADKALGQFPESIDALDTAGDIAVKRKDYKKAISLYTPVAQSRKSDIGYLLKIADCYKQMGDLDKAIKLGNDAANIDGNNIEVHIALGRYYLENKEFLGARLQLERALELHPDYDVKQTCFAPFLKVLNIMNDDKAINDWTARWIEEHPDKAICHYNRGWYLTQAKKDKLAEESYKAALACDPKMNTARYNLIYLYYKNGQKEEAMNQSKIFLEASNSQEDRARVEAMLESLKKAGH